MPLGQPVLLAPYFKPGSECEFSSAPTALCWLTRAPGPLLLAEAGDPLAWTPAAQCRPCALPHVLFRLAFDPHLALALNGLGISPCFSLSSTTGPDLSNMSGLPETGLAFGPVSFYF